jgi:tetratricopeptide (TPR) repeat protein
MQESNTNQSSKLEPGYESYIKATSNATVRLDIDTSPAIVHGLAVDALGDGLAMIIQSVDGRRFSLTHTDLEFNIKAIIEECFWVRPAAKLTVVVGMLYSDLESATYKKLHQSILPWLRKAQREAGFPLELDIETYKKPVSAVAISRQGTIKFFSAKVTLGRCAPLAELRGCTNSLNRSLIDIKGKHGFDVQFDARNWTFFPKVPILLPTRSPMTTSQGNFLRLHGSTRSNMNKIMPDAYKAYKEGRFDDAVIGFNDCLAWQQHCKETVDEDLTTAYYNLGSAYMSGGNHKQAFYYLRLAYANRGQVKDIDALETQKIYKKLSEVMRNLLPFDPLLPATTKISPPRTPCFIECGQDGICRLDIDKSPPQIQGLFTQGIQTCVPLLIVGKNRISLIHDSGKLRVSNILEEAKWVHEVEYWTIAYHPAFIPEGLNDSRLKEKMSRYRPSLEDHIGKDLFRQNQEGLFPMPVPFGRFSISREKHLNLDERPTNFEAAPGTFQDYRFRMNALYNVLATREGMQADLQFDGSYFTQPPKLPYPLADMHTLMKTTTKECKDAWCMFLDLFLPEYALKLRVATYGLVASQPLSTSGEPEINRSSQYK